MTQYPLTDAISLLKGFKTSKFDETVELSINLGVDPKHADQQIRGTVSLPHGIGKDIRVLAIAKGEKQKEATEAGTTSPL